jgi:hypothetical protein
MTYFNSYRFRLICSTILTTNRTQLVIYARDVVPIFQIEDDGTLRRIRLTYHATLYYRVIRNNDNKIIEIKSQ